MQSLMFLDFFRSEVIKEKPLGGGRADPTPPPW